MGPGTGYRVYDPTIGIAPVYYGPGKAGPTGERDILSSVQNLSILKYGGYDPRVQGGGTTQTNPNQVLYEGRWIAPELVALLQVTKGAPGLPFEREYVPTIESAAPVSDIMSEFASRAWQRASDAARPFAEEAQVSIPVSTGPGFSTQQQQMSVQMPSYPSYPAAEPMPGPERPDRPPTSEEQAEFTETMVGLNHYAYGRPRGMAALEGAVTATPASTYEPYTHPGTPPPGPTPPPRPAPGPSPVPFVYTPVVTVPYVGGPVRMMITQPQVSVARQNLRNAIREMEAKAVRDARARGEKERQLWEADQAQIKQLRADPRGRGLDISAIEAFRKLRLMKEEHAKKRDQWELESLREQLDARDTQQRGVASPPTWGAGTESFIESPLVRWLTRGLVFDYVKSQGLSKEAAASVADTYERYGAKAATEEGYREGYKEFKKKVPSIWTVVTSALDQANKEVLRPAGAAVREQATALLTQAEAEISSFKQSATRAAISQLAVEEFDKALVKAVGRPTFGRENTSDIIAWATKLKYGLMAVQEALVGQTGDRDVDLYGRAKIPAELVPQVKQVLDWVASKYGEQLNQSLSEALSHDDFGHEGRQWNGVLDTLRIIDRLRYDLKILAPQNVDVAKEKLFPGPLKLMAPEGEFLFPAPVMIAEAPRAPWEQGWLPAPTPRAVPRETPMRFPPGVVLEAQARPLPELQVRRSVVTGQAEVAVGARPVAQTVVGRATAEVMTDAQAQGISAMERLGQAAAAAITGAPPQMSVQSRIRQIDQQLRATAAEAGQDISIDQERSRLFAERGQLQRALR
jgi:hypothetical protein